jgi:hypothetical protein
MTRRFPVAHVLCACRGHEPATAHQNCTRYSRCDPSAQMLAELADTHDSEMIIIGISRSGMQSHDLPLMGPAVASSPLGWGAL